MLPLNSAVNRRKISPEIIFRCVISTICGVFTQFSLFLIPNFFGFFSLLFQIILSVVVLFFTIVFGQLVRRFIGVRASAPAFVIFHVIFIWLIYIVVVRPAVSPLINILFNGMVAFLLIGFVRMLVSDPGFVRCDLPSSVEVRVSEDFAHQEELTSPAASRYSPNLTGEGSMSPLRVRYCRSCQSHVLGFDHHCPAFGNCIGQKNHALFMVLLIGFILTEVLYALIAYQWAESNERKNVGSSEIAQNLAVSTMIFSLIQVLWQVPFLLWHVYCVCINLRTDEWINWRRYPEFHAIVHPSQSSSELSFRNPYHKGIFSNVRDFFRV